ncbi:MAG TPA: metal ABC transporter substrate-binding protein [Planctomycetota bacterium]|nr:metal ABC transporter substrate-binding protein [Planctomycetota bacterium]
MLRRIVRAFAAAALLFSLATAQEQAVAKLKVVTTLGVLEDLAKQIGGDRVVVESLSDPRQDPHYVEPKPTLMQKAREADVFIEVGLQLELWGAKVAEGSGNPKIQTGQPGRVAASSGIETLELPTSISREWGDVHPYGNPHVWLDPLNAKKMAENISQAFSKLDAAHAADYAKRLADFDARIDTSMFGAELVKQVGGEKLTRLARQGRLDAYLEEKKLGASLGGWMKATLPLRGRPVITYHKTSIYFANRFGLVIPVEIEEKPGIPPSARHRDHVIELIKAQGVHTIMQEIFYDRSAADYLAAQTGVHVIVVPIDVGSEVDVADYFALIQNLVDRLLESEKP